MLAILPLLPKGVTGVVGESSNRSLFLSIIDEMDPASDLTSRSSSKVIRMLFFRLVDAGRRLATDGMAVLALIVFAGVDEGPPPPPAVCCDC